MSNEELDTLIDRMGVMPSQYHSEGWSCPHCGVRWCSVHLWLVQESLDMLWAALSFTDARNR